MDRVEGRECTDPGGGYVRWGLVSAEHLDCAPLDAAVHPFQRDDCATETDANCDGVFTSVYASEDAGRTPRVDIANQIMSAGPTDAPTYVPIIIQEYGEVIIDLPDPATSLTGMHLWVRWRSASSSMPCPWLAPCST